ncbi:sigma-54 interaction domain-containing protein [Desulfitobacterium metallireducens]|uniref:Fis family transcriptional regulator n=1 Tax=Desulfitobacterium metallireducens DSM 15288 TaxID=871968 RepID=W0ECJ0_9FIRM|nr:sigma 54-interacting transcriptional regulator [Desulfitobacterium metallireducens]AHF06776.1 Fis family transcriptional regulator [Desulfitobacterium metallireducens DSM 15288]
MSQKVRVGIIGAGKGGTSVYKMLRAIENVEIVIVCDIRVNAPGIVLACQDGIKASKTIEEFCQQDMDVIIEATGLPEVQQKIEHLKATHTSVMEAEGANLMMHLIEEKVKFSEIKHFQESRLNEITTSTFTFDDIIGCHPDFERSVTLARKAAKSNSTVLILGESGTGKELFAHAIHSASQRSEKSFIKVNCAANPVTLLESELFGHEKGAFNEALKIKIGKMELANEGTIFLDEIGDMNLYLQSKLLRVLQDMEFERLGGMQTIKVDVRVIAATNRNLREMVRQGEFREDLFYRLNVVELRLPPLRKHKEDVLAYAQSYIMKFNHKFGKRVVGMNTQAEQILLNYPWPGNVRELQNVIERAMVIVDGDIITPKQLSNLVENGMGDSSEKNIGELMPLDVLEKKMIRLALQRYGESVEGKKKAAQSLNISLATLYNKLKTL